jgi:outer membrane immunogenic protein
MGDAMKKLILGSVALAAILAGPAMAADLKVKAPVLKAPPPAPVYSWSGFYIGVNAGYTWNDDSVTVLTANVFDNTAALSVLGATYGPTAAVASTGILSTKTRSFIGGGQIGYNHQTGSLVTGIEADFQGVASGDSSTLINVAPRIGFFPPNTVAAAIVASQRLDDIGTVRGRLGFLFAPSVLAYATGGLAYGQVESSTALGGFELPNTGSSSFASFGSISTWRAGWTVGGGLEWAFAHNWSAKAEYLYYDLGTVSYALSPSTAILTGTTTVAFVNTSLSSTRFNGNIVRAGINYKLDWAAPFATRY